MAGEEQAHTNRRKAERPTGPGTPEGKGDVSENGVKHGPSARKDVIEGEDPQEFERHRQQMLGELAPVGAMEATLAERIVSLSWRLKRAERLQNEVLEHLTTKETSSPLAKLVESLLAEDVDLMGDDPETDPNLAVGRAVAKDFANDGVLDRLSICEQQIESRLFRAMAELQRLQLKRKP